MSWTIERRQLRHVRSWFEELLLLWGFYVLALLIVESFLAAVLIFAEIPTSERMTGVWVGAGMFTLVIIVLVTLLRTDESANQIYTRLEPHLDDDINLFITEIGSDHQGWLPHKAWKWIRKHVDRESRSNTQMQPAQ